MRWPFGPPHLTLKPSKKNKKQRKQTKTKNKKTNQKSKKKKRKSKKTQKYQKELFRYQSKFSIFCGGVQKLPFLTTWPRKCAPPKHYKNWGFSLFFEISYASRNGHFWTKKAQIQKVQLSFFLPFLLFQQQKTPKLAETPIFIVF